MKQYVKLFESFIETQEQEAIERIYESWRADLPEDLAVIFEGYWDEEEELTSGESAASKRGDQILTKPQMAALYLRALGETEDDLGKYTIMIPGMREFGEIDPESREFYISGPAFADAIGLESIGTVSRTTKKFSNMIEGIGETGEEILYPKLIKAYEFFKTQSPKEISMMAGEAVLDPAASTKHRDAYLLKPGMDKQKRIEKKAWELKTGESVYRLFLSLSQSISYLKNDTAKAVAMAVGKVAKETNEDPSYIKECYRKFLASKNILSSINYK